MNQHLDRAAADLAQEWSDTRIPKEDRRDVRVGLQELNDFTIIKNANRRKHDTRNRYTENTAR